MTPFQLDIVTIYGNHYSEKVESVLVHTDDGDVEILAGHADFLASVATGRARIIKDGNHRLASCSGGFISVTKSGVKLVTTTFEFADEIDQWIIDAIKSIGFDTAKDVINAPREILIEKADLEEDTVDWVLSILKAEFEEEENSAES
jgi:F0F1-type ATP synthase epsilon subunit